MVKMKLIGRGKLITHEQLIEGVPADIENISKIGST